MDFNNRVCQTLHDEHSATLDLFGRLEQLLGRHKRGEPADSADPVVARLMRDLTTWVDAEIGRHFDFEEHELFAYLDEHGDHALGASLTGDHRVIRPLGAQVGALAREASRRPLAQAEWSEFWRLGQELCGQINAHVQKEEMALLPAIEDAMEPEAEARLYQEYADTL